MLPPFLITRLRRISSWLTVLALVAITVLLWCVQSDRLAPANWRIPLNYSGDSMEMLVRFKAVADGELVPFFPQKLSRLGAPFGADWSEYPVSDKLLFFFFGHVAKITGVNAASNLAVLFACVTAALAFYGCARFLRGRREWCFAGALLFAFTYQTLARSLPHLWLAYAYTVPCALLTCWLVASARRLNQHAPAFAFCLVTSAVLGISNPYNFFLFLQLLALAIFVQLLVRRRKPNLRLGAACLAVSMLACAALQIDTWLYPVDEGATPLIVRNYGGTELYALKPIELFIPPTKHNVAALAEIGYRYLRWSDFKGETFYPYLGLIGAVGFIWIFIELIGRLFSRSSARLPAYGLQIAWIIFFSAVGGINSLLSLYFGLDIFRATNRFSIFISAIVLLFLVSRLSRLSRRWPRLLSFVLAAVVTVIGLYDQLPRPASAAEKEQILVRLKSDRALGGKLEAALPPGSMVFQLPVVDFPETRPPNHLADYEHFRLYLSTKTLRFSYGALKGRSPARWQHDYEQLEPRALASALEEAGFAAICIDRRGYPDRAEALLAGLSKGRSMLADSEDFAVVRLQPATKPRPPLARSLSFGQGWNPRDPADDEHTRWTNGSASFSFYNPYPSAIQVALRFTVNGVDKRHFILRINDHEQFRATLDADPLEVNLPQIELQPGINRFELVTPEASVRVSEERWRLRALAVHGLSFQVIPASLPSP
ncbi:MAG: hypothetical protein KGJ37_00700 [Verrucomicrobiota bacterium]|nr:hypothetical protein [Verrucomicrobiota bacterium]